MIPPIFANTEVVRLTEQLYEAKIVEPKIIVVDVELPPYQKSVVVHTQYHEIC